MCEPYPCFSLTSEATAEDSFIHAQANNTVSNMNISFGFLSSILPMLLEFVRRGQEHELQIEPPNNGVMIQGYIPHPATAQVGSPGRISFSQDPLESFFGCSQQEPYLPLDIYLLLSASEMTSY